LVIDLNVCTRCDDCCVRGCKDTHGGIPRFVRENRSETSSLRGRAIIAEDPVCLVGCPTGAIRRTDVGDVVAIDDTCALAVLRANNCPYDAITMHDTAASGWRHDS